MRIKFYSRHDWGFVCVSSCCICILVFSCVSVLSADRPAPRKPFVSKASTSGTASKPLPAGSTTSSKANVSSSDTQKNSGQAEIVMITRSHKAPSVRPVIPDQKGEAPVSTQATDSAVSSGSGTQAQVGKIIERQ